MRNKKNNVYPCKPQFYYIKVGFQGVKIILACFRDEKDLGGKNRGVQEGQYFMALTGPIFYGINQAMRL